MKSDQQIIFDQAVTISDLTEERIYLQEQLAMAEERINQLYQTIERHERELRGYRAITNPTTYNPMNRSGNL
jgi:hypothetical protein